MKLMRMHNALVLTVAGALAFGCSGGDDDTGVTIRDGGPGAVRDGGPSGVRDGGPADPCGDGVCDSAGGETFVTCPADCMPPDPCPDGDEGCECNSTWVDGDPAYLQDDCVAGNLCVPWDTLSGRQDLTGPLQSCVKPCAADAECGAGRTCGTWPAFPETTGVNRFCVDSVAEDDKYCGTTKLTTPRVAGVTIQTGANIIGCSGASECAFGVLEALHPDEGVCLQFCGGTGDPACGGTRPYCNPKLFTQTATDGTTIDVGLCSTAQLGVGSWCRPTLADSPGLTQICDTSDNTLGQVTCVGLGVQYGLCMELCDTTATPPAQPCEGTDATQGALFCEDGLLTNGGGICMTPNCDNFPDTCAGDGAEGNGRFCVGLTMDNGVCADRRSPLLAASVVSTDGMLQQTDDCQAEEMGFTQCPEGAECIGAQTGGACVIGCQVADTTYCEGALTNLGLGTANSTCAAVLQDPLVGLCAGD